MTMNRHFKITPALSARFNEKDGKGVRLLTPDELADAGSLAHRDRAIPGDEMWQRVAVLSDPLTGTFRVVAKPEHEDSHEMAMDEDNLPALPFGIGNVRLMAPR
jgi:hypothetical protein